MDAHQRLILNNMLSAYNHEDTTEMIRKLKHSYVLREDVNNLIMLKSKYPEDPDSLHLEAMNLCSFLFTYYTDIYNKIRKDEIDIKLLYKAFDILKDIEDGKIDQHEGAFEFSTIMTKINLDSALKRSEKLDANEEPREVYKGPQVNMSWKDFKKLSK
jgi:hypothetical protein